MYQEIIRRDKSINDKNNFKNNYKFKTKLLL